MNAKSDSPQEGTGENTAESTEKEPTTSRKASVGLSKKEKRRRQQRSHILMALSIIVLVLVSVALFFGYQEFQKSRSEIAPDQVALEVSSGGNKTEVKPYSACRYDEKDCAQGAPAEIKIAEGENLNIHIPKAVYDHPWALIRIYDDPAANTEEYYKANEKKELSLPVTTSVSSDSSSKEARLVVVEISSALIGTYEGAEEPYQVTWSITPR